MTPFSSIRLALAAAFAGVSPECLRYQVCPLVEKPACTISNIQTIGISSVGAICGEYDCGLGDKFVPYFHDGNSLTIVPLPPQNPYGLISDINDAEVAVGYMHLENQGLKNVAFVYARGVTTALPNIPDGFFSRAYAVNNADPPTITSLSLML